jgi:ABC-type Fe3+-hydroxamate transport system substrate-binding protein
MQDDLGVALDLDRPARRVVSLVPSLTEAVAATRPEALVGATDWCTHPADLDVPRVRGTKNPDLAAIRDLRPDVVIANREENRELDVRRLRESGVQVWVTVIETVPQAFDAMDRLLGEALGWGAPAWLTEARAAWDRPETGVRVRAAVPIWRDPWMVVGRETFTRDLLRRLGVANVFDDWEGRYPSVSVEEILAAGPEVVLLPDEPYVFTPEDGPEAFPSVDVQLVSGRLITWYGPSLLEAASLELV